MNRCDYLKPLHYQRKTNTLLSMIVDNNRFLWILALCFFVTACSSTDPSRQDSSVVDQPGAVNASTKVLVFSKTTGFRHNSIESGIAAINNLGTTNGFAVDATEDGSEFTSANLAQYDAVIFLNTNGIDVLNADQKLAFENYIQQGGGYVGIHSAAATEYEWPWYGELVGAYFDDHPEPQTAEVLVTIKD